MVPKSPKIEPWGPQNVVKKSNLFLYRFRGPPALIFLPFWGPFWDPKEVQIGAKTWKIRCPKIVWFFHWFYDGLGRVFQRFFDGFWKSKFHGSLGSDFVKKLTKHWPWRQNQGSAFYNFSKKYKKIWQICMFLGTSILYLFFEDFWRAWGAQNSWFSHFFCIFFHSNFEAFFWTAKNAIFEKRIVILGPFGGPCGPGKQSLELGFMRKTLIHTLKEWSVLM